MKHRALLLATLLAGCSDHRTVTLLLGPDNSTLTAGFTCKDDAGNLLLDQSRTNGTYSFQLVFETVDLGQTLPGCRGEEIHKVCTNQTCKRVSRVCRSVHIPVSSKASDILDSLHAQLDHPTLVPDAPDDPVVVRAVATLQSCSEVMPQTGDYPKLDPDMAVGCAYSCPVVLGELKGSLGMALDTLDDQCGAEVRACAKLGGS